MPAPKVVPATEAPSNNPPGRSKRVTVKIITSQLQDMKDTILSLEPADAVMFHLTRDDHPDFAFTGARLAHLKDRCRRMFRGCLDDVGVDSSREGPFSVRYEVFHERLPSDEVLVTGFKAYVIRDGIE